MGIQYLNKLIRTKCSGALKQIPLSNLRKKVIVIDTSIYLYRFAGEGGIVDGMYQMISILLMNHIIPVFVGVFNVSKLGFSRLKFDPAGIIMLPSGPIKSIIALTISFGLPLKL